MPEKKRLKYSAVESMDSSHFINLLLPRLAVRSRGVGWFSVISVSGGNSEGGSGNMLPCVSEQKDPCWFFLLMRCLTFYTNCSVSYAHIQPYEH